jgi:hypothetical protein
MRPGTSLAGRRYIVSVRGKVGRGVLTAPRLGGLRTACLPQCLWAASNSKRSGAHWDHEPPVGRDSVEPIFDPATAGEANAVSILPGPGSEDARCARTACGGSIDSTESRPTFRFMGSVEPRCQRAADVPSANRLQKCRQDAGSTIRFTGSVRSDFTDTATPFSKTTRHSPSSPCTCPCCN